MDAKSIHQFTVKNIKGEDVKLQDYEGKVLLIVNTASKCGFTPQLEDMEALYKSYRDKGLEVLAFPSNDFMDQEPLEGEEIEHFCMVNYNATYPIFEKSHVTGKNASELFQFLSQKEKNGKFNAKPKWNFQKYLVDQSGKVVNFFYSFTKPNSNKVRKEIDALLSKANKPG